jgi:sulfite reductase (NADPH) flavoprotein alpha-component
MLHTGEGLWWLGLIFGLAVLSVPAMAVTGALIW